MGIWIRTQNGNTLVNCNHISIWQRDGVPISICGDYDCGKPEEMPFILGEYESEKEAIAAFDMIQNTLTDCIEFVCSNTTRASHERALRVFQMPQKGFSERNDEKDIESMCANSGHPKCPIDGICVCGKEKELP